MRKRLPDDVLDYFRKEGARGGSIGAKTMTAAQRKARAKKGGLAAAASRRKKKNATTAP